MTSAEDIRAASFPEDREAVLAIFREYVASTKVSLDYQGHAAEFATLPGHYAPPEGGLLLAWQAGVVVGCAAWRRVDAERCELKRVYVRPATRRTGIGRRLVERALTLAGDAGYRHVCLDVLPEFEAARRLYAELGFRDAEPVSFNPIPGTAFLGRNLPYPPMPPGA